MQIGQRALVRACLQMDGNHILEDDPRFAELMADRPPHQRGVMVEAVLTGRGWRLPS